MASFLGEFEQLVLLAILQRGEDAYGAGLERELERRTHRRVSLGAIYTTLLRLEEKGLVAGRIGEPLHERGGRRRKYYRVLPPGLKSLERAMKTLRAMSAGLPKPLEAP